MFHYEYITSGVCPKTINFDLDGDRVYNIKFLGGCDGNLKAISTLVNGWTIDEIADKLDGNLCRKRGTSCADQLVKGIREGFAASRA